MALPVWPETLPQEPIMNGFVENYPNNQLRSAFDSGVAKTRRKGATPPFRFTFPMRLTSTQRSTLYSFVGTTLQDATLRFEITHPLDGSTAELRIVPESGDTLFTVTTRGIDFYTTITVEVLP